MLHRPEAVAQSGARATVRDAAVHFTDSAGNTFVARGKWYEFYRLLIQREGAAVDRHALCQLKSWGSDSLANGRDVARHLQSQRIQRLLKTTVTSEAVTHEWRLSGGWTIDDGTESGTLPAIFKPDAVSYGAVGLPEAADIDAWAFRAIDAHLKFCAGDVPAAFAASEDALGRAPSDDVRSISLLLCLRIGPRLPPSDALLDVLERYSEQLRSLPSTALTDHARQRYSLYRSLYLPESEWAQLARRLEAIVAAPSPILDPITLGYALNYAAVTSRRLGDLTHAARQIERALVHAIAGGELFMLQAVLFNFGLIHSDLARRTPGADHGQRAIQALQAVSRITRSHRIGNDSAQNELAIAAILIDRGDFAKGEEYLEEARRIIARSENAYDAAVLAHRRLQLRIAREGNPRATKEIQTLVDSCAELYAACERDDLAKSMRADIKQRLNTGSIRS